MNLKDAAANLNQAHPEDTLHPLYTPWGELLMRSGSYDDILSEYPRPQMRRTDYHMLNGLWEYAFVPADGSSSSEDPAHFTAQGIIRVPFSPEALLSRVHRRLEPTEYLWYHRELSFSTEELSQKEENMHCILHFDAVDQEATVFLGTKQLGIHSGGYLPFSLDITEYVNEDPVSLYVKVRDLTDTGYATRGKQTLNRGGMFYTAQSGIWQSVWYEWVPENYVINSYFLHGILDQGYWSDGLMTAPCDEAFVYDINLAKGLGFNMLRKHIKIESLRWYYHCDRLGMIVWQDMVSGGSTYHMPWVCYMPTLFPHMSAHTKDNHYELFSRSSEEGRKSWEQECLDTIDHLYNVPSIAVWVPFNEGWGQFDAARIAKMVAKKDPTRPVDHASGWFDQKGGDFRSIHNYFRPLQVKLDGKRAFVISEYGGYACHIAGHSSVNRVYGYQKYDTPEEMAAALKLLFSRQLFPLISKGLSGAVYTQLSDVEEEVNGLVTYDRRVVKLPVGHPFAAPSSFAAPYSHGNKPE